MRYFALILALLAVPAFADTRVPTTQAEITLSFAPLVEQAAPAVVNIYARRVTETRRRTPFMDDPFFERFFEGLEPEPRVQSSLGSGVILGASGIVVSNFHVVGMATDIRVVLTDRREFEARVLLGDAESDLAILQLEGAQDLPFLPLRPSEEVRVGELVLAIGNPFGVGQTVSSGIVSGLARSGGAGAANGRNGAGRGYFIQTDAPINPGNSGGALIDMAGRLIGINTQILTRSGGSNGIGFAIPADLVAAFVQQAEAGREAFARPWAGMAGQPVEADMAGALGLDVARGILISALHPASPFLQAGFAVGDIITAVDGRPVNTPAEMVYRMSVAGMGGTSNVTRVRDGALEDVPVRLLVAPDDPPRNPQTFQPPFPLAGLTLARVNPAVLAELNLPIMAEGLVVTGVQGNARRAGLRPGDLIEGVNGQAVQTPRDFRRAVERGGRRQQITLLRGNRRVALRFRL
ncbi:MAG: trypsin-like peptidase domain-containing protein [Pseudomonadota bacterium]